MSHVCWESTNLFQQYNIVNFLLFIIFFYVKYIIIYTLWISSLALMCIVYCHGTSLCLRWSHLHQSQGLWLCRYSYSALGLLCGIYIRQSHAPACCWMPAQNNIILGQHFRQLVMSHPSLVYLLVPGTTGPLFWFCMTTVAAEFMALAAFSFLL